MSTELTTRDERQVAISDRARRYVRKSRAPNTVRAYRSAWREFEHFAAGRGAKALPATPETVIEYLAALADAGAKVSTINVKLTAVASAHRKANVADPTVFQMVKAVMDGIRRELKTRPAKKEPATLAEIRAMVGALDLETAKGKRDRALLLVGFAGAFRRSELVALDVADARFDGGKLQIIVRRSKTDQAGKGMVKTIPVIGGDLCPVAALRAWLDAADIGSGPIFRRVDRHGNVHEKRLTPQSVALVVKSAARDAGLDWRAFSGHSLRSGFITGAADGGASDGDIIEQTGQKIDTMLDYRKATGVGASRAVLAAFAEAKGEDAEQGRQMELEV